MAGGHGGGHRRPKSSVVFLLQFTASVVFLGGLLWILAGR